MNLIFGQEISQKWWSIVTNRAKLQQIALNLPNFNQSPSFGHIGPETENFAKT